MVMLSDRKLKTMSLLLSGQKWRSQSFTVMFLHPVMTLSDAIDLHRLRKPTMPICQLFYSRFYLITSRLTKPKIKIMKMPIRAFPVPNIPALESPFHYTDLVTELTSEEVHIRHLSWSFLVNICNSGSHASSGISSGGNSLFPQSLHSGGRSIHTVSSNHSGDSLLAKPSGDKNGFNFGDLKLMPPLTLDSLSPPTSMPGYSVMDSNFGLKDRPTNMEITYVGQGYVENQGNSSNWIFKN